MLRLEDREWAEFRIGDLFEVMGVRGLPSEKYKKGHLPYISTSAVNNGLIDFVSADEDAVSGGNVISVDPIKGKAFYHGYGFVGRGFSGASVNLLCNENMNKYIGLFLVSAIEMTSKSKASYGNLFNSHRLRNGKILLPFASVGIPDWQFMEGYVKERYELLINRYKDYIGESVGSKKA